MNLPTENVSGVYCFTHRPTGRVYVGSSTQVATRVAAHLRTLRRAGHENKRLQAAFHDSGEHTFACELLEIVADDRLALRRREEHWITVLGATSPDRGFNRHARPSLKREGPPPGSRVRMRFDFSPDTVRLFGSVAERLGISERSAIEVAIRLLAKREGVK